MVTKVKTFCFHEDELGEGDEWENLPGPKLGERINSWAEKNRVRIVNVSVCSMTRSGDTYGFLATVVYEQ